MSMKMDRRAFLKAMGAAGVTTALVSAPVTALAATDKWPEAGLRLAAPAEKAGELLASVPKDLLLCT